MRARFEHRDELRFLWEILSKMRLAGLEEDLSWFKSGDGRVEIVFYFDWYDVRIFLIM